MLSIPVIRRGPALLSRVTAPLGEKIPIVVKAISAETPVRWAGNNTVDAVRRQGQRQIIGIATGDAYCLVLEFTRSSVRLHRFGLLNHGWSSLLSIKERSDGSSSMRFLLATNPSRPEKARPPNKSPGWRPSFGRAQGTIDVPSVKYRDPVSKVQTRQRDWCAATRSTDWEETWT